MNGQNDIDLLEKFRQTLPNTDNGNKVIYCRKQLTPDLLKIVSGIIGSNDLKLISRYVAGCAKVCPTCGKYHCRQGKTCSQQCSEALRAKTNIEKYGCANPLSNAEIQKKCIETTKRKYGVTDDITNVSQIKEIQNIIKRTNLEKYGSEWYAGTDDCIKKSKQTCLEKYGVSSYVKTQEYKERVQKTNLERYGTEWNISSDSTRTKRAETCLKRYGDTSYMRSKEGAERALKLAQQKLIERLRNVGAKNLQDANLDFLQSFIEKHDDSDYFNVFACAEHFGISRYLAERLKSVYHIFIPNYNTHGKSVAENLLFEWIPANDKFCNVRNVIPPLELDLYISSCKLAIEYNGVYYHSAHFKDSKYHLNKTLECSNKGIQLFHIFESDDIDIWKSMISNKLKLNTKIYARKCIIKEITNSDAKSFCEQNHLQGACNAKINLGLFYNDELIQVMTFGKPRYNSHYEFELLRLCTKKYYSVIGGASKLWKCFCQKYSPKSVISYANRRFSNGSIYETLGFKFLNETKPNYWYVHTSSFEQISRLKAQKHKLKTFLKVFDENLTETENMLKNGYVQIFDCGNLVFVYNNE